MVKPGAANLITYIMSGVRGTPPVRRGSRFTKFDNSVNRGTIARHAVSTLHVSISGSDFREPRRLVHGALPFQACSEASFTAPGEIPRAPAMVIHLKRWRRNRAADHELSFTTGCTWHPSAISRVHSTSVVGKTQMSNASFLEAMAPLLVALGLLWGAIIWILLDLRRERKRLGGRD